MELAEFIDRFPGFQISFFFSRLCDDGAIEFCSGVAQSALKSVNLARCHADSTWICEFVVVVFLIDLFGVLQ